MVKVMWCILWLYACMTVTHAGKLGLQVTNGTNCLTEVGWILYNLGWVALCYTKIERWGKEDVDREKRKKEAEEWETNYKKCGI